jgi:hypothetical protein
MQGNEAIRVDNGDIERKSNENEKLTIGQQSVIKNQGVMQIPNYEVLEKIGVGGSAIVYKARREKDSLLASAASNSINATFLTQIFQRSSQGM